MTIWRWERDGSFPQHLVVHGRNYWLYSEVKDWIASQKRRNAAPAAGSGG
jgi:predicted DNA-binding transcriptional regulator AlpA